jgi:acyl-CoA reductase-like NAD-dependent aldehyde dehydrogenase
MSPDVRAGTRRVDVRKTYKLAIGGAFPRSESGRSYQVFDARARFLANAAQASRKDARDAVEAAAKAQPAWAGAAAFNRGQVLYRAAEMMEGRHAQFTDDVARAEGLTPARARAVVDAAIDRWVWYAGWSDKLAQVAGALNPVAGPYFNLSVPEPTGVVAVIAPQDSSLLGLVSTVAPVIVSGNACVVLASQERPLPAITLSEVLATSDLPGGVLNVLTGITAEVAPWLASHEQVAAIDLAGAAGQPGQRGDGNEGETSLDWVELERAAAQTLTRVMRPADGEIDWAAMPPGPRRALAFTETKTVWHPKGR